jgi:phosphoenolpyruvate carboxylase
MAGQIIELLDRLEEILKQSLPEDKAKEAKQIIAELSAEISKETLESEIPRIEEKLSKQLATKEDLYKLKEELKGEIYQVKEELKEDIYLIKQDLNRIEKELLTIKILLWVVVILTGTSFFPQLLNLLKLLK